jgi:anti-sigma regulatory factor (Ser/Thr protein kinase)
LTRGYTHQAFPIDDPSRVGEARRHAAALAARIGFDEVEIGRLSLVVTELGTNLSRHAHRGRLLIAARPQSDDIEVLSIDEGPGIAHLGLAMQDGQSSGSTPGTGLGAVKRLASGFDIHSSVPGGTVCVARVGRRLAAHAAAAPNPEELVFGALALCAPGETVCGDSWAVEVDGSRAALIVADGLGHGPDAAKASQAAIDRFEADRRGDQRSLLQAVHVALQSTRGAAVCLARADAHARTLVYTGAGNIVGRVVSGVFDKSVITQHGTAGLQIRAPQETLIEWPAHSLVILHSDGINTRWQAKDVLSTLRCDPVLVAAILLRDHIRGRDDATVVVLGRRS